MNRPTKLHGRVKDITGNKYGRLTAVSYKTRGKWVFKCDCGNIVACRRECVIKGITKSCGCYQKDQLKLRIIPGRSATGTAFALFKYQAKIRKLEINLTKEQWLHIVLKPCVYCGMQFSRVLKSKPGLGNVPCNSIDRVDNSLGYSVTNSVSCCQICNSFKSDFSKDLFLTHIEKIFLFQRGE